jgi:branched-chain amino acid aminotransferase
MALLPIHEFFCINGQLETCSEFVEAENEGGVYEVLRVVDGIPLFLEDHLQRFYHSAEIAGKSIRFSSGQILKMLNDLIEMNGVNEGNLLISCKLNLKAFFIPHVYPSSDDYKFGVKCGLLHAERHNPNAKVFQTRVRTEANIKIAEHGYFEVILVDHNNNITEGSRSNLFLVREGRFFTPQSGKVLLGITRQKTIACAKRLHFVVEEQDIHLSDLRSFEAAFITGTSPKILPVRKIGGMEFDINLNKVRQLMNRYDEMIQEYVADKKKRPSQA